MLVGIFRLTSCLACVRNRTPCVAQTNTKKQIVLDLSFCFPCFLKMAQLLLQDKWSRYYNSWSFFNWNLTAVYKPITVGGSMFKNYFKIALRNIRRYKTYSFINIIGLAIGMACCIMILLYVQDELSYDSYHANADHIYRLIAQGKSSGGEERRNAAIGAPIATSKFFI